MLVAATIASAGTGGGSAAVTALAAKAAKAIAYVKAKVLAARPQEWFSLAQRPASLSTTLATLLRRPPPRPPSP